MSSRRLLMRTVIIFIMISCITIFWKLRHVFKMNIQNLANSPFDPLTNPYVKQFKMTNNDVTNRIEIKTKLRPEPEYKEKNPFFVIMEKSKFYGQTKYCHMEFNNETQNKFKYDYEFQRIFSESKINRRGVYNLLNNCNFKNCFFACDNNGSKSYEPDALLFHGDDNTLDGLNLLKSRSARQIWMLWHDEPRELPNMFDSLNFNWTISFHSSSEVSYCSYGCYKDIGDGKLGRPVFSKLIEIEFNKRKNTNVWFVSNCQSELRIQFAAQLADKYPGLYTTGCIEDIQRYTQKARYILKCPHNSDCEPNYLNSNKFYLAFESQNVTDYITEKFWRSLNYGIIPVVFQPSKESYARIAPIDSFIHAQDFDYDINKLATYLHRVSTEFSLYLKHLKWRRHFKIVFRSDETESYRMCEMCTLLNTFKIHSFYSSVSKWFDKFKNDNFELNS